MKTILSFHLDFPSRFPYPNSFDSEKWGWGAVVKLWVFHSSIFHSHSCLDDARMCKIESEIWIISEKFQQFRGGKRGKMEKVEQVESEKLTCELSIQVRQFLHKFLSIHIHCDVEWIPYVIHFNWTTGIFWQSREIGFLLTINFWIRQDTAFN